MRARDFLTEGIKDWFSSKSKTPPDLESPTWADMRMGQQILFHLSDLALQYQQEAIKNDGGSGGPNYKSITELHRQCQESLRNLLIFSFKEETWSPTLRLIFSLKKENWNPALIKAGKDIVNNFKQKISQLSVPVTYTPPIDHSIERQMEFGDDALWNKMTQLHKQVVAAYKQALAVNPNDQNIKNLFDQWNGSGGAIGFLQTGYSDDDDWAEEVIELGNNVIDLFNSYSKKNT